MSDVVNETVEKDLAITQGDDWSRSLNLELSQGSLSGLVEMTILHPDTAAVLEYLSTDNGKVVIDSATQATFTITNAVSSTFPSERRCPYDVQVTLPSGLKKTPMKGGIWVGWQATQ